MRDTVVRYLWQGLDANLALATPMREEGDAIEGVNRRVRNNEAAAKRVHAECQGSDSPYRPYSRQAPTSLW